MTSKEFWKLIGVVGDPGILLGCEESEVRRLIASTPAESQRIVTLLTAATALAFELERFGQLGYSIFSPFSELYPARLRERLRDAAPALLHAVGRVDILAKDGIGIVGSRDVSPEGFEAAAEVARAAVRQGMPVVSGGAKGVDQSSMAAAFQAGGEVVGVLADSLEKRLKDPETRRAVTGGDVCLLTPFKPSAGFSVGNVMGRNKVIYALSQVTVAIASDTKGGTWEGATESMRRGFGSVAVWTGPGSGPGNAELIVRGGLPVGEPDAVLEIEAVSTQDPAQQMALGL